MILFSATDSKALLNFSQEHLSNKKMIKSAANQPALDKIFHTMYRCSRNDKTQTLFILLETINCERALIFTRTKNDVNLLADKLNQRGFSSQGIHNEIPQKKRLERLNGFKNKQFNFLVATDIASRGIDIDDLYYVINFDLPVNSNDYIHRVGRTARASASNTTQSKKEASKGNNLKQPSDFPLSRNAMHYLIIYRQAKRGRKVVVPFKCRHSAIVPYKLFSSIVKDLSCDTRLNKFGNFCMCFSHQQITLSQ